MRAGQRYLYLSRHNIYYFRVIVPVGESHCSVKQEYRRSLRTRSPQKARYLGDVMRLCWEQQGVTGELGVMEWAEIKEVLDKKLLQLIATEKVKIKQDGPYSVGAENHWEHLTLVDLKSTLRTLGRDIGCHVDKESIVVPQYLGEMACKIFLEDHGIEEFDSDAQFLQVCEALLHRLIHFYNELLHENREARSVSPTVRNYTEKPKDQLELGATVGPLISQVAVEFCDEMIAGDNWRPKTAAEYRALFDLLIEVINDEPIAAVGYDQGRYFKKALQRLPSNRKKKAQYREKSIAELLSMDIPLSDVISPKRMNDNLTRVSALFAWAQRNGYKNLNPFENLKAKIQKPAIENRLPFDHDDLQCIFSTKIYREGVFKHPYYYWLSLVALYTGARIEEICQLHLTDIYEYQDFYVIDINDNGEKRLKNSVSKRVLPMHSKLAGLGLVEYVQDLKNKGKKHLFSELKPVKGRYSHNAGAWFNRNRKKWGVTHACKSFHSFRHTVIDELKQDHVEGPLIQAISGHSSKDTTYNTYGSKYKPESLRPIIEKLNFPIDISGYYEFK